MINEDNLKMFLESILRELHKDAPNIYKFYCNELDKVFEEDTKLTKKIGCGELFKPNHFGMICGEISPLNNKVMLCKKCEKSTEQGKDKQI